MDILLDIASWILILAGCFFCLTGGIGLIRLPDYYTRCHAAGVTDTLGATLLLCGLLLQAGITLLSVKIFIIMIFLLFTSPVSGHAVARAALSRGVTPVLSPERLDDSSTPTSKEGKPSST